MVTVISNIGTSINALLLFYQDNVQQEIQTNGGNVGGVFLLPGEQTMVILKDVMYLCPYLGTISGKLIITNYKLWFEGLSPANKVNT